MSAGSPFTSAHEWPPKRRPESTVRDLVAGSGLRFDDRGTQTLKGVPEAVRLYAVVRAVPALA
jgi:hypothetical protein